MFDSIITQFPPRPGVTLVGSHDGHQAVIAGKARVHPRDHHWDVCQLSSHSFLQHRSPVTNTGCSEMDAGWILGAVALDEIEELTAWRLDA